MFMFVFSVLTISIVGLFFQIVTAMMAIFMSQQMAMGEQMLKWHALAYQYACSTTLATGAVITASDIGSRASEVSGSYAWNSIFFTGTYGTAIGTKMVVTYVTPTETPGGYTSSLLAQQLTKVTTAQHYRFSRSTISQTANFTTYEDGTATSVTIQSLPAAVVPNSIVLVSDATCG